MVIAAEDQSFYDAIDKTDAQNNVNGASESIYQETFIKEIKEEPIETDQIIEDPNRFVKQLIMNITVEEFNFNLQSELKKFASNLYSQPMANNYLDMCPTSPLINIKSPFTPNAIQAINDLKSVFNF